MENNRRKSIIWKLSKEEFENVIKKYTTMADILRHFNLKNEGNRITINKRIIEDNIDTSHFCSSSKEKPLEDNNELFVIQETYKRMNKTLVSTLLKNNIFEYKYKNCGITEWNNNRLTLELDHINGNNCDNRIENLRFLCPNCHSQTDTWRGRNVKRTFTIRQKPKCIDCNKDISRRAKRCVDCNKKNKRQNAKKVKIINESGKCVDCNKDLLYKYAKRCISCASIFSQMKQRKVERPPLEQLLQEIDELGYLQTGKKYGVSNTTIRNWVKVETKISEIKKSKEIK